MSTLNPRPTKSQTGPSTPDYIQAVRNVYRFDTHTFRNRLCHVTNCLLKIDRTVQKITRIVERQAAKRKEL